MSKRKRPPRSARSRVTAPRPTGGNKRTPAKGGANARSIGLWLNGVHAVVAALQNPKRRCHRLIVTRQTMESLSEHLPASVKITPEPEIVERAEIDTICGADSVHQGVALLVDPLDDIHIEDVINAAGGETDTLIVLDQATDPRNIGSVMRSARAFGARAVVVQDRNAPPETATMAKAASGAMEHIALVRVTNLARAIWSLKDAGYWTLGLDGTANEDISNVDPTPKRAIVLGAEGAGLRRLTRETVDQLVCIPIEADSESLNLSNACAVALYEITRNRK